MTYKLVDYGPTRGVPALHFYRSEAWDLGNLSAQLADICKDYGLLGGKRLAIIDGVAGMRSGWKDDDEVEKLITFLQDFGFIVETHHGGSEFPSWARRGFDVTVVDPQAKWMQFGTGAIVFTGVPQEAFMVPGHLEPVPKYIAVPSRVDVAALAKFVTESPYPWHVQLGPVGGMEVEL